MNTNPAIGSGAIRRRRNRPQPVQTRPSGAKTVRAWARRRPVAGATAVARIVPQGWRELPATGPAQRRVETLLQFASGLRADLTVIHGVHWTRLDGDTAAFGEIDFVIVSADARILLVQQKSGFLTEAAGGMLGAYHGGQRVVAVELSRTLDAVRARLAPLVQGEPFDVDFLLYCPDFTIRRPGSAGIPPERIVDTVRRDHLNEAILAALPARPARPQLASRLVRFFSDQLQLVPDVAALLGRAEQMVTRLSGGLASWARRLEFQPFRLQVIGTAGSGKTQLAASLLHDAAARHQRTLYVCFNRPLADHLAAVTPNADCVMTFHQFADRALRRAGTPVDHGSPRAFEQMERAVATLPVPDEERVDDLIIDEGQDLQPAWRQALLERLAPDGRAWWLEDPMQNLYDRSSADLPGWVRMRADTNYRSPRSILAQINRVVRPPREIEAASPFAGHDVEYLNYPDPAQIGSATLRAVTLALQGGLRLDDIAIVTFSGRERSRLLRHERLGPHRLISWTGRFDLLGAPEYRDGDVRIETVYRFKGQSAPCVVLTEVDFEQFDDLVARKLFVGMTRATMRLFVVASARAAAAIATRAAPP